MSMDVRLIIKSGSSKTSVVRLLGRETLVGRHKDCHVRIPSSAVSRHHCRLIYKNGVLTAEDLDSVNGTLVNGQLIRARHVVRPGDELTIGPIVFVARYQLGKEA